MLWLYGGAGYLGGAHLGAYNGSSFARDGVIVVTANYRLGTLGNFAHPALTKAAGPSEGLGGYALMDAVAALQWVQRNAKAFGGDPKNVTLFGQSAGGGMVMSLLSIPSAKGLYQKAIVESGAALGPGSPLAEAETGGAKIADALGLPGATATLAQLRAVPPPRSSPRPTPARHAPPLDGRFRTTATVDALKAHSEIDVPLMVGTNTGEPAPTARALRSSWPPAGASFLYQFAYVPAWRTAEQPNGAALRRDPLRLRQPRHLGHRRRRARTDATARSPSGCIPAGSPSPRPSPSAARSPARRLRLARLHGGRRRAVWRCCGRDAVPVKKDSTCRNLAVLSRPAGPAGVIGARPLGRPARRPSPIPRQPAPAARPAPPRPRHRQGRPW